MLRREESQRHLAPQELERQHFRWGRVVTRAAASRPLLSSSTASTLNAAGRFDPNAVSSAFANSVSEDSCLAESCPRFAEKQPVSMMNREYRGVPLHDQGGVKLPVAFLSKPCVRSSLSHERLAQANSSRRTDVALSLVVWSAENQETSPSPARRTVRIVHSCCCQVNLLGIHGKAGWNVEKMYRYWRGSGQGAASSSD